MPGPLAAGENFILKGHISNQLFGIGDETVDGGGRPWTGAQPGKALGPRFGPRGPRPTEAPRGPGPEPGARGAGPGAQARDPGGWAGTRMSGGRRGKSEVV